VAVRKKRSAGNRSARSGKPEPRQATPIAWPRVIGEAVIIGLVLSVPLLINTKSRNICDIKDATLGLGAAAGLGLWLLAALRRGEISWLKSKLNLVVFLFVAWAAISIFYARYRYVTVSEFGRLVAHLGLFWLAILSLRSLQQVRRVMAAGAVVAIPICIYGFYQAAGEDFVDWSVPVERVFSFMGNPTYLGGFLMLMIPAVIALGISYLQSDRSEPTRPTAWTGYAAAGFFFAVVVAMSVCLYYSKTIAGAIGLGLAAVLVFVVLLVRGGARAVRVLIPAAGIVLVVLCPIAYLAYSRLPAIEQQRIQQIVHLQDPESAERRVHRQAALSIWRERPTIGEGYGAFRVYSLEKMAPEWYLQESGGGADKMLVPGYAHNEYLQVLAELGVVGGVLFFGLLLAVYALAIWLAARHPDPRWATISLGIIAGFTALLFQNTIGITFRQTGAVTFFWLWLAVLVLAAAVRPAAGQESAAPRLREFRFRRLPVAGLISIAVVLVAAWWFLWGIAVNPIIASQEVRQAQGLAALGRYKDAAEHADHAISLCPYSSMAYYVSAYAWGQTGNFDKALASNRKALDLMPGNASIYYNLGVSYKSKGQLKDAEDCFKNAIKYMPTNFRHHAAMAETLMADKRLKEAEPYARETVRLAPTETAAHLLLADLLGREGKSREMVEQLEQASAMSPTDVRLKQQITVFYLNAGEIEKAMKAAQAWMQADPTAPLPHNIIGTYYLKQRQYGPAKAELERAVQLDPNNILGRYNLALSLGHLNQLPAAVAQLRQVILRGPSTAEARKAKELLDSLSRPASPRPPR
jgi:tetratricopeptide (TPR) repeat protein